MIFINLYRSKYHLTNLCAALDISKRTYYKYRNKEDSDYGDYLVIKEVFGESKGTYGYRRIQEGIRLKYGVIFNHKKVNRIMRKYRLIPSYIKKTKSTYRRIESNVKSDLVNRQFHPQKRNQVWSTDITYLIFGSHRAYLSTIIDLYDNQIVSYQISKRNDNELVIDTLNRALSIRKDVSGLIIHSDQGFQYTSHQYKVICESHQIQISMSRKGTPLDNSPIESFHALLKKETLYNYHITSLNHYIQLVHEWLAFYSSSRLRKRK